MLGHSKLEWCRTLPSSRLGARCGRRRTGTCSRCTPEKTADLESGVVSEIRLTLRALIYRDDAWWVAHCLETDVVAEGNTPTQAFEHLQSLTALQITTAVDEGDLQSIFRQAPSEILSSFAVGYDRPFRRRPPERVERFDARTLQPV